MHWRRDHARSCNPLHLFLRHRFYQMSPGHLPFLESGSKALIRVSPSGIKVVFTRCSVDTSSLRHLLIGCIFYLFILDWYPCASVSSVISWMILCLQRCNSVRAKYLARINLTICLQSSSHSQCEPKGSKIETEVKCCQIDYFARKFKIKAVNH